MFKVGDKVRVLNKNGIVVHIDNNDDLLRYLVVDKHNHILWCSDDELELIPPTPKEMLKVGMVVENNIGFLFMVYKNKSDNILFINECGNYSQLKNYNDNLINNYRERYDIVKIYGLCDSNSNLNEISVNCRDLIWERKPEYYNGKVVCINDNNSVFFTKGKVYKVEKGIVDNDGHTESHYFGSQIKNIDDLNSRSSIKFIELAED